jgi:hypothetical protein
VEPEDPTRPANQAKTAGPDDPDQGWLDLLVAMDESIAHGEAPQVEATDRGVEAACLPG